MHKLCFDSPAKLTIICHQCLQFTCKLKTNKSKLKVSTFCFPFLLHYGAVVLNNDWADDDKLPGTLGTTLTHISIKTLWHWQLRYSVCVSISSYKILHTQNKSFWQVKNIFSSNWYIAKITVIVEEIDVQFLQQKVHFDFGYSGRNVDRKHMHYKKA